MLFTPTCDPSGATTLTSLALIESLILRSAMLFLHLFGSAATAHELPT